MAQKALWSQKDSTLGAGSSSVNGASWASGRAEATPPRTGSSPFSSMAGGMAEALSLRRHYPDRFMRSATHGVALSARPSARAPAV
ncbi:hypothetical protein GCM10009550_67470 [Actinocorallia libanotica]|uniref:Uncharacterized protein n=1 Tax=Actinocorallia libanotica TaxID=46162 RepID=A0ABN1RW90_9ACTN